MINIFGSIFEDVPYIYVKTRVYYEKDVVESGTDDELVYGHV